MKDEEIYRLKVMSPNQQSARSGRTAHDIVSADERTTHSQSSLECIAEQERTYVPLTATGTCHAFANVNAAATSAAL